MPSIPTQIDLLQNLATGLVLLSSRLTVEFMNESAELVFETSFTRARGLHVEDIALGSTDLVNGCKVAQSSQERVYLPSLTMLVPSVLVEKSVDCVITVVDDQLLIELTEVGGEHPLSREANFVQRQQSNQAVIRGLAHEILNPLGGIRGAAQLLESEIESPTLQEYTGVIIKESDRLTNLVNRMQATTRVDFDQTLNIHSVIEHVRQLVLADTALLGEKKITIVQDYDPSLPNVHGNFELLVQALLNILRNAVEAIDLHSDGQVALRTRIESTALQGKKQQVVRIDIADNGVGVDHAMQGRIFDPMVTSKVNGTGLGLAITAEIIASHLGAIDFYSQLGKTVFSVFLPVDPILKGTV